MRRKLLLVVLLTASVAAALAWWPHRAQAPAELALYGNIDLRQVDLAFNNSERISAVLVQEGDRVKRGQVLARLDTSRLTPQVAQVEAQAAAQRQVVERLHNGSRPEEIAQGRASLAAAKADAANARQHYERLKKLAALSSGALSEDELESANSAADNSDAKVQVNQTALDLLVLGPRKEDIAQAEAQLRGNEAQLAYLRQQLSDAELFAPAEGVVRTRLLEPGDMATPQKPVFSLALIDPKWARVYVSEPDLGKLHPGIAASLTADSFPGRRFAGWIGFISPIAEFTPKDVQTTELRTSLVYEVRVFVKDPDDDLRLGMPVTATVPLTTAEPLGQPTAHDSGPQSAREAATANGTAKENSR